MVLNERDINDRIGAGDVVWIEKSINGRPIKVPGLVRRIIRNGPAIGKQMIFFYTVNDDH